MHESEPTLPAHIERLVTDLPMLITLRDGAEVISRHLFRVADRSLERWPIEARVVAGRRMVRTRELLTLAYERWVTAPLCAAAQSPPPPPELVA